ncbi:MAG: polyphosphate kinase 1 [Oscillospiraceae bacterium]|nr:polyphosphate kinase 1 [Oscillospiraceae bacterium]
MNKYYDNRELSWLKFNERVLEEARDNTVPLCERLLFASIFQSNLDEFFMVRVGSLYDRTLVDDEDKENKTGMTCSQQLDAIFKRCAELAPVRDAAYIEIMKELQEKYGIEQVDFRALSDEEEAFLKTYFTMEILPLISPQIIDKRHPFPFLKNKETYAVARLESKQSVKLGLIPASGAFSRVIFLPTPNRIRFMLVEELILHYMPLVFSNCKIVCKSIMRITRNADINMEEALYDHDVDLREVMSDLLKKRKKLSPVRMELTRKMDDASLHYLCRQLELKPTQIFRQKTPLDLSCVFTLRAKLEDTDPCLFYKNADPQNSADVDHSAPMMPQIRRRDIMLSYPYESIKPFLRMLNEAANDPDVVSIKITLYRVASNSKVVEALINAAENGKDVLVLVELRARFDEENNIGWSKRLEKAGCSVIYGPENLKVHSKLCLITKKAGGKVEHITQIGTGNYNEKTSALYTDLCLMTANEDIAAEANEVFNALSMNTLVENSKHLLVAPLSLQNRIIRLIDGEIEKAERGQDAYIGLKLNSLTDKVLIDKLVEASRHGVKIQMVVRGICCLVAGIPGDTENIEVISIVGRYLEHARIYMFGRGEDMKLYISSADFMTRNTIRRVEVAAPVYDEHVRRRIVHIFKAMISDNVKARVMQPDSTYRHRTPKEGEKAIDSQAYFISKAYRDLRRKQEAPPAKEKHSKKVRPRRIGGKNKSV